MFELRFKRVTITFDFSFFAVMSLMMLFENSKYLLVCFVACLLHESGHLIVLLLNKVKLNKVCFYGAGIKIIPDKLFDFTSDETKFAVLIAGCLFNFITFLLLKSSSNTLLRIFALVNAGIGAFNILPLHFLDGGKILVLIIHKLCDYRRAILLEQFVKWINVLLIIIVIILFAVIGKENITLYVTLCCLLFSALAYS